MKRMVVLVATAAALIICGAGMAQQIEGVYFFADRPFPEYMPLWQEGWEFKGEDGKKLIYARPDMPLGGYVFIYYKNTGSSPMTVSDLTIGTPPSSPPTGGTKGGSEGVKMSEALIKDEELQRAEDRYRSSILLSKLPKTQIEKLKEYGWPAWWLPEPRTVQPGEQGEIVLRLKRPTKPGQLKIGVVTDQGTFSATVVMSKVQPQFGTIAFSPDYKTVYLYPRQTMPEIQPLKVILDGKDVTKSAAITCDKTMLLAAVTLKLDQALKPITYHTFRVEYADGSAAQAGIRAWGHELIYGMFSSPSLLSDPEQALKSFTDDYALHQINCVMPYVVGGERNYFETDAGWDYMESKGVGRMTHWPDPKSKYADTFLFAQDEPDAMDAHFPEVPPADRLGAVGQWLVNWTRILHKSGKSPVLLNVDNTYKPENYYTYHQLCDIPCVDPYYTEYQNYEDFFDPHNYQYHTRPTYVQAVATISQSSCQPKPLHVILLSCRYQGRNFKGRFPTPEEKRIEAFYSIGAGAKGLSYWMFPSDPNCACLTDGTKEAKELWDHIGLIGAEVRTAGPVIATSCPADLPTKASDYLWSKTLLSGNDTLAVVTVNENVACDRLGTVVRPCQDAQVNVALPSWLEPKDAFEVTSDGIRDITWKRDRESVNLSLGTVRISSLVVVTANPELRAQLQGRYTKMFAANVAKIKAGMQQ